jgi:hypothetical protein
MASDLYLAGVSQMDDREVTAGLPDLSALMKALKPACPIRTRSFPFFTEAQPSIGTVVTE